MLVLEFRPYKRIDREEINRWLEITDKEGNKARILLTKNPTNGYIKFVLDDKEQNFKVSRINRYE